LYSRSVTLSGTEVIGVEQSDGDYTELLGKMVQRNVKTK